MFSGLICLLEVKKVLNELMSYLFKDIYFILLCVIIIIIIIMGKMG